MKSMMKHKNITKKKKILIKSRRKVLLGNNINI